VRQTKLVNVWVHYKIVWLYFYFLKNYTKLLLLISFLTFFFKLEKNVTSVLSCYLRFLVSHSFLFIFRMTALYSRVVSRERHCGKTRRTGWSIAIRGQDTTNSSSSVVCFICEQRMSPTMRTQAPLISTPAKIRWWVTALVMKRYSEDPLILSRTSNAIKSIVDTSKST